MAASRVGRKRHQYLMNATLKSFIDTTFIIALLSSCIHNVSSLKIGIMHYGSHGRLGITCNRDELILISSEVLGFSRDSECNPRPMCSVPYTLAKWYCRGKSSCSGIPVERRPLHKRTCGSDFTNCLRVEYHCVKRSKLIDVCQDKEIQHTTHGYITSPSFPDMYPPDQNCTCKIYSNSYTPTQLKSIFFLLKASQPCHDWIKIKTDGHGKGSRCGYNPREVVFRGKEIEVNFRSDSHSQEMGFWMEYRTTERHGVTLKCGSNFLSGLKQRKGMTTMFDLIKWHKQNKLNTDYAKQGLDRGTGEKVYLRSSAIANKPTITDKAESTDLGSTPFMKQKQNIPNDNMNQKIRPKQTKDQIYKAKTTDLGSNPFMKQKQNIPNYDMNQKLRPIQARNHISRVFQSTPKNKMQNEKVDRGIQKNLQLKKESYQQTLQPKMTVNKFQVLTVNETNLLANEINSDNLVTATEANSRKNNINTINPKIIKKKNDHWKQGTEENDRFTIFNENSKFHFTKNQRFRGPRILINKKNRRPMMRFYDPKTGRFGWRPARRMRPRFENFQQNRIFQPRLSRMEENLGIDEKADAPNVVKKASFQSKTYEIIPLEIVDNNNSNDIFKVNVITTERTTVPILGYNVSTTTTVYNISTTFSHSSINSSTTQNMTNISKENFTNDGVVTSSNILPENSTNLSTNGSVFESTYPIANLTKVGEDIYITENILTGLYTEKLKNVNFTNSSNGNTTNINNPENYLYTNNSYSINFINTTTAEATTKTAEMLASTTVARIKIPYITSTTMTTSLYRDDTLPEITTNNSTIITTILQDDNFKITSKINSTKENTPLTDVNENTIIGTVTISSPSVSSPEVTHVIDTEKQNTKNIQLKHMKELPEGAAGGGIYDMLLYTDENDEKHNVTNNNKSMLKNYIYNNKTESNINLQVKKENNGKQSETLNEKIQSTSPPKKQIKELPLDKSNIQMIKAYSVSNNNTALPAQIPYVTEEIQINNLESNNSLNIKNKENQTKLINKVRVEGNFEQEFTSNTDYNVDYVKPKAVIETFHLLGTHSILDDPPTTKETENITPKSDNDKDEDSNTINISHEENKMNGMNYDMKNIKHNLVDLTSPLDSNTEVIHRSKLQQGSADLYKNTGTSSNGLMHKYSKSQKEDGPIFIDTRDLQSNDPNVLPNKVIKSDFHDVNSNKFNLINENEESVLSNNHLESNEYKGQFTVEVDNEESNTMSTSKLQDPTYEKNDLNNEYTAISQNVQSSKFPLNEIMHDPLATWQERYNAWASYYYSLYRQKFEKDQTMKQKINEKEYEDNNYNTPNNNVPTNNNDVYESQDTEYRDSLDELQENNKIYDEPESNQESYEPTLIEYLNEYKGKVQNYNYQEESEVIETAGNESTKNPQDKIKIENGINENPEFQYVQDSDTETYDSILYENAKTKYDQNNGNDKLLLSGPQKLNIIEYKQASKLSILNDAPSTATSLEEEEENDDGDDDDVNDDDDEYRWVVNEPLLTDTKDYIINNVQLPLINTSAMKIILTDQNKSLENISQNITKAKHTKADILKNNITQNEKGLKFTRLENKNVTEDNVLAYKIKTKADVQHNKTDQQNTFPEMGDAVILDIAESKDYSKVLESIHLKLFTSGEQNILPVTSAVTGYQVGEVITMDPSFKQEKTTSIDTASVVTPDTTTESLESNMPNVKVDHMERFAKNGVDFSEPSYPIKKQQSEQLQDHVSLATTIQTKDNMNAFKVNEANYKDIAYENESIYSSDSHNNDNISPSEADTMRKIHKSGETDNYEMEYDDKPSENEQVYTEEILNTNRNNETENVVQIDEHFMDNEINEMEMEEPIDEYTVTEDGNNISAEEQFTDDVLSYDNELITDEYTTIEDDNIPAKELSHNDGYSYSSKKEQDSTDNSIEDSSEENGGIKDIKNFGIGSFSAIPNEESLIPSEEDLISNEHNAEYYETDINEILPNLEEEIQKNEDNYINSNNIENDHVDTDIKNLNPNGNEYNPEHWWNQYWQEKWQETWRKYHSKHDTSDALPKHNRSDWYKYPHTGWEPSPKEFLKPDFDYQKPIIPPYLGSLDPDNLPPGISKDQQIARWNNVYGKWFSLDDKQPIQDFIKVIKRKWEEKHKQRDNQYNNYLTAEYPLQGISYPEGELSQEAVDYLTSQNMFGADGKIWDNSNNKPSYSHSPESDAFSVKQTIKPFEIDTNKTPWDARFTKDKNNYEIDEYLSSVEKINDKINLNHDTEIPSFQYKAKHNVDTFESNEKHLNAIDVPWDRRYMDKTEKNIKKYDSKMMSNSNDVKQVKPDNQARNTNKYTNRWEIPPPISKGKNIEKSPWDARFINSENMNQEKGQIQSLVDDWKVQNHNIKSSMSTDNKPMDIVTATWDIRARNKLEPSNYFENNRKTPITNHNIQTNHEIQKDVINDIPRNDHLGSNNYLSNNIKPYDHHINIHHRQEMKTPYIKDEYMNTFDANKQNHILYSSEQSNEVSIPIDWQDGNLYKHIKEPDEKSTGTDINVVVPRQQWPEEKNYHVRQNQYQVPQDNPSIPLIDLKKDKSWEQSNNDHFNQIDQHNPMASWELSNNEHKNVPWETIDETWNRKTDVKFHDPFNHNTQEPWNNYKNSHNAFIATHNRAQHHENVPLQPNNLAENKKFKHFNTENNNLHIHPEANHHESQAVFEHVHIKSKPWLLNKETIGTSHDSSHLKHHSMQDAKQAPDIKLNTPINGKRLNIQKDVHYAPPIVDENPNSWPFKWPFNNNNMDEKSPDWMGKPKPQFTLITRPPHVTGKFRPAVNGNVALSDGSLDIVLPAGNILNKKKRKMMKNNDNRQQNTPNKDWWNKTKYKMTPPPWKQTKNTIRLRDHGIYNRNRTKNVSKSKFRQNKGFPSKQGVPFRNESRYTWQQNNQQNKHNQRSYPQEHPGRTPSHNQPMSKNQHDYPYGVLPTNMRHNLGDVDPTLYDKIQNYLGHQGGQNKNLLGSKMAAMESKKDKTKGADKDTVWVLLVLAIVGWLIFMVMVGLLVYYKRERMCHKKMMRRHGYTSSYASSLPKHLLFPDIHSPLCAMTNPHAASSIDHSPTIPTRPHSANSNDSLLGLSKQPKTDPCQRRKRKQQEQIIHPQLHMLALSDNESYSNHSGFSNSAISDRPLPKIPSAFSSSFNVPPDFRTNTSSMCAEMAFSTNSSTESIGVQEIIGNSNIADAKSNCSAGTFKSSKSHYQSLNTIRDRKAKSRSFSNIKQLEETFTNFKQKNSTDSESSGVSNHHVTENVPQMITQVPNIHQTRQRTADVRPDTPVLKQKNTKSKLSSKLSTFMPLETQLSSEITTTLISNTDSNSLLSQTQQIEQTQNAEISNQIANSSSAIPHQYPQASTPFNKRRPSPANSIVNQPVIKKGTTDSLRNGAKPVKPERSHGSKPVKSVKPNDTMDDIYMSLTKIATKYDDSKHQQNQSILPPRMEDLNHTTNVDDNFPILPPPLTSSQVFPPSQGDSSTNVYQNGHMLMSLDRNKNNTDTLEDIDPDVTPPEISVFTVSGLYDSGGNSSLPRTIRSPSNDQVYLQTAPNMLSNEITNADATYPSNNSTTHEGTNSLVSNSTLTSVSDNSTTTLMSSLNTTGNHSFKSPIITVPPTNKLPNAKDAFPGKPPLGIPGIHHSRGNPTPGSDQHKHHLNATAKRIITTLSKTKPGSSAERIKKIIPEQATVFNEKVKPELNRILSQRTGRFPVQV